MKKNRNFIIFTITFLILFGLIFYTGYFRKPAGKESDVFKITLSDKDTISVEKPVIFDIQDKGTDKEFIQPGRVTISIEYGYGIVNTSSVPVPLHVMASGFGGKVKIGSGDPNFDEERACCREPLPPGSTLNLNICLDIPLNDINDYIVSQGRIAFSDWGGTGRNH